MNPATRSTLIIAGERLWCRANALRVIGPADAEPVLWVAEDAPEGSWSIRGRNCHQVLGREVGTLVFDTFGGFDPDAFGAATGTLRGGGLLLLLTPPLDDWPRFDDPEKRRIATAPYSAEQVGGRFLRRFARILRDDAHCALIEQHGPRNDPIPPTAPVASRKQNAGIASDDQALAVAAVVKVASGQRRRPVVLTADRGRGKSAALGIAAAHLLLAGTRSIAVTGPRLESVQPVFEHCARTLADADSEPDAGLTQKGAGAIHWGDGTLIYLAPDQLLNEPRPLELLMVDEAAALPTALLERLLRQYNRIAFATTVHGYEGSGRGFALRFTRSLDRGTRGWRALQMQTPIRWAHNDPLEALTFRGLLLNAEAAPDEAAVTANAAECRVETLDREQFADDERTLGELFGLLVLAHYRTRPYDLRHLLDGPNLTVMILRHRGHVVATALVAAEGGFDSADCRDIWAGRRRPHGHLLPESLSAHLGLEQAPRLRCFRIMRIAVHPAARRRGLGIQLLNAVAVLAEQRDIDYLGSSFGADPELMAFWERVGYCPVRISIKPSAASGSHSALMLQGINAAGNTLVEQARRRFYAHLPRQLGDHLQELDPRLAIQLLHGFSPLPGLDEQDWLDLIAFSCARRVYEACLSPIWKMTLTALAVGAGQSPLDEQQRVLLIRRVVQQQSYQLLSEKSGLSGRAAVVATLRRALRLLVFHYGDSATQTRAAEVLRENDATLP